MELLGLLRLKVGPPAAMADDLLDELQVAEKELLGGQVVAEGVGWPLGFVLVVVRAE